MRCLDWLTSIAFVTKTEAANFSLVWDRLQNAVISLFWSQLLVNVEIIGPMKSLASKISHSIPDVFHRQTTLKYKIWESCSYQALLGDSQYPVSSLKSDAIKKPVSFKHFFSMYFSMELFVWCGALFFVLFSFVCLLCTNILRKRPPGVLPQPMESDRH